MEQESYRRLVLDILVHIGTNMLLCEGSNPINNKRFDIANPLCVAQSIMVLEHFNGTDDVDVVMNSRVVRSKWNDLWLGDGSTKRDALKFYRKRITCECLKKMHLEARKKEPKMGMCHHCREEMERVSLFACGRCMVGQYCSRECQVAQWPAHKQICDDFVAKR